MIAAIIAVKPPTRNMVNPPTVSKSKGGPSIARIVGFAASAAATSRPAASSLMVER